VLLGKNGVRYDRLIATRGNDYMLVYDYNSNPIEINLKKISGKKKQLWWMDAATGKLTYLGQSSDKTYRYTPSRGNKKVADGVLIAVDASKKYLTIDQQEISGISLADKKRDLNE
jgi:hypothetical protein